MRTPHPSFEAVYRAHARDVYTFAFWLCGDRSEAEDLTAEAFLRAFAGASDVRAATVRAYLLTIAKNLYLSSRARRRGRVELDEAIVDGAPSPEARAEARSEAAAVRRALRALPVGERAALLLRAEGGLDYGAVAAALGTTVSAARVRVHRARLRLAAALTTQGPRP